MSRRLSVKAGSDWRSPPRSAVTTRTGSRDTRTSRTPTPAKDRIHVVLDGTRNPLNIGAAARAMSNFGFFSLRLAGAYRDAVEEAKSAVHAEAVLRDAAEFAELSPALADCELVVGTLAATGRSLHHRLLTLEAAAPLILAAPGPVALVFGSEKYGLANDALDRCHWLTRIPSRPEHGSINLGQAVAIVLYELIRDATASAPTLDHRATQSELRRFEDLLFECLNEAGYARTPATEGKIRRMVRRLEIPPHDAQVWNGIFRQILWRLRHNQGEPSDPT